MYKPLFCLAMIFVLRSAHAQTGTADILEQLLVKQKMDTGQVILLQKLSKVLLYTSPDQAMDRAQKGLHLSRQLKYTSGEAVCLNSISSIYEIRKKNLQLIGIAVFIPSFFLFVLFLSRRKAKPRTVEFLGILALLLVFEFITLLVHPYIEHLTNDAPSIMLLILVGIAAFLVPLHHKLEKWVKERLAHKGVSKTVPVVVEGGA